ncbi:MAG: hypothetical protein APR62_12760 [Smithella sp. SDB]|nr:MAG: hypothetical protein APR62_12760 [Smithella sp. SDB]
MKVTTWYTKEDCKDWNDFLNKVRKLPQDTFYRGQKSYPFDKPQIQSSFDRAANSAKGAVDEARKHKRELWEYEAAIIREFMRRAHHYVSDTPQNEDRLEWLSLMRHFGAPTRLVDFTYSYYIAAYFAFSNLGDEDRAVWAIDQDWLRNESQKHCKSILGSTSRKEIDVSTPEKFTKCFLDPTRKSRASRFFVAPVNAERMNTRLTIQQGCFLCSSNIQKPFEYNLSSMVTKSSCQQFIVKFVIPHSARNDALTELKHMNITKASLFPDLGGLAESLNDRFELLFKDYNIETATLKKVVTWHKRIW